MRNRDIEFEGMRSRAETRRQIRRSPGIMNGAALVSGAIHAYISARVQSMLSNASGSLILSVQEAGSGYPDSLRAVQTGMMRSSGWISRTGFVP